MNSACPGGRGSSSSSAALLPLHFFSILLIASSFWCCCCGSFANAYSLANIEETGTYNFYNNGMFKGPKVWIFNNRKNKKKSSIQIYNPAGDTLHATIPESHYCPPTDDDKAPVCNIHSVVSDYKRYVFAASSSHSDASKSKFHAFDVNTGGIVGIFNNDCLWKSNNDRHHNSRRKRNGLSYHSLQNELWSHCYSPSSLVDDENTCETHVWSVQDSYPQLSSSSKKNIRVVNKNNTVNKLLIDDESYVIDPQTLGTAAYVLPPWHKVSQPTLYKVDTLHKTLQEEIVLNVAGNENATSTYGIQELTYSKVNQHLFVRTVVCCTCESLKDGCDGSEGAIPSGPFAGQIGVCSPVCDGVAGIDTGGVLEIDTASDSHPIVATHYTIYTNDWETYNNHKGDPYASKDGRWIVLFSEKTNSTDFRILKAGENGKPSTVAFDVYLSSYEINDFVFVHTKPSNLIDETERDYLFLDLDSSDKIAIIDLAHADSSRKPKMYFVTLQDGDGGYGAVRKRRVEWVEGTPYVWVSSDIRGDDDKDDGGEMIFVVDVDQRKVVSTFDLRQFGSSVVMLAVRNDEMEMATMIAKEEIIEALLARDALAAAFGDDTGVVTDDDNDGATTDDSTKTGDDDDGTTTDDNSKMGDDDDGSKMGVSQDLVKEYVTTLTNQQTNQQNSTSVAALLIGLVSLFVGVANLMYLKKLKQTIESTADSKTEGNFNLSVDDKSIT